MLADNQDQVIDKASRIIDIINLHLDENPPCQHKLQDILKDL